MCQRHTSRQHLILCSTLFHFVHFERKTWNRLVISWSTAVVQLYPSCVVVWNGSSPPTLLVGVIELCFRLAMKNDLESTSQSWKCWTLQKWRLQIRLREIIWKEAEIQKFAECWLQSYKSSIFPRLVGINNPIYWSSRIVANCEVLPCSRSHQSRVHRPSDYQHSNL